MELPVKHAVLRLVALVSSQRRDQADRVEPGWRIDPGKFSARGQQITEMANLRG